MLSLVPVEVKSRVSHRSENDAINALKKHLGVSCPPLSHRKPFLQVNSTDASVLHKLLANPDGKKNQFKGECIQLLHHAFVYGATSGLFIIGNRNKVIYAIEVIFSPTLLLAYEEVVDYLFENYFKTFYDTSLENFPKEKIEEALAIRNEKKKKKNVIDMHSFWTNFLLWRALNVNISDDIKFPLPPSSRIIPIQHSWWNATKGPSDTTTKLLDNCEEQLGVRNPQTIATARLLAIGGVVFHRCHQILTAKDCSHYQSITAFRRAANKRAPFWKSLVLLCEFLGNEKDILNPKPPQPPERNVTPQASRRRTRNGTKTQVVNWIANGETGCTPKKGRSLKRKSANKNILAHNLREKQCVGVTLVRRVNDRGICKMCRMKTSYYCTGCKSWFCFVTEDFGNKINKMEENQTISEGTTPAHVLTMASKKKDGTTCKPIKVHNSCYHVGHASQFGEFFRKKNDSNVETTGAENVPPP